MVLRIKNISGRDAASCGAGMIGSKADRSNEAKATVEYRLGQSAQPGMAGLRAARLLYGAGHVALHESEEFIAVFVLHVHELDAAAVGANVADHGGEVDFAQAGADFQTNGIADAQFLGGGQIGPAEADGFYASQAGLRAIDVGAERRFEGNAHVAARNHVAGAGLRRSFEGGTRAAGGRAIFNEGESFLGGGPQSRGLGKS